VKIDSKSPSFSAVGSGEGHSDVAETMVTLEGGQIIIDAGVLDLVGAGIYAHDESKESSISVNVLRFSEVENESASEYSEVGFDTGTMLGGGSGDSLWKNVGSLSFSDKEEYFLEVMRPTISSKLRIMFTYS
jgi:hypothetical protein